MKGALMSRVAVGDVRWNAEAGSVTGLSTKEPARAADDKGHVRRCPAKDPQCEVKNDKTDHVASHKMHALTKLK